MGERAEERVVGVSGAGGSLGRALVRQLLSRGLCVRGMVIDDREAAIIEPLGAVPVPGDMREPESLARLVEGCEVVFHLAAWIMRPFDPMLARAVNIEGTRQLVRAAAQAGCRRVVMASSISVYGPRRDGVWHEDSPFWSVGDPYSDSKVGAELAAREEAAQGGIELVILRPTFIYGPASPPWTVEPYKLISRGLPVVIGDGKDFVDPVYVDDVAHAFELAGFTPGIRGEAFNVGGQLTTWNEFLGHYARMAGVKLSRVPAALARSSTRIGAVAARMVGKPPRFIPEMVNVMTSRARFPSDKARRILGYRPRVSLEEGMQRTERWLREVGLLKRPRVVLVTGAASGLGKATARELKARGLTVWATGVRTANLTGLEGEGIHTLQLDVTSEASITRAVEEIERRSGPVDVVVNVAGVLKPGPLEIQSLDECRSQLEVNTLGPLRVARAVTEGMRRRGFGRIINVSSTNGFITTPFMGAYSASKHALEAISDALRMELKPWGVDVSVIQPAAMNTGIAERARSALRGSYQHEHSAWRHYLERFLSSSVWGDRSAEPVERVARLIARAVLSRRPLRRTKALQAVGARLLSLLPSAMTDFILMRVVGLSGKAPRALPPARQRSPRRLTLIQGVRSTKD